MTHDKDHDMVEVVSRCPDCGDELGRKSFQRREVAKSGRSVDRERAEALPDREAMSLVNANLAIPINLAAALNVLSDGSIAYADATQTTPIDQSTATQLPGT
jgi:hypothetical protein